MMKYSQLLLANRAWAAELTDERPDFFARQMTNQIPEFLWIGCTDGRVGPEQMTMMPTGDMCLHRNIGNLVNTDDLNLMSVLHYTVTELKVRHVIVCGHYGCAAMKATLAGGAEGPVDRWLDGARDVARDHADELAALPDEEAKLSRLVEVNVQDQVLKLARTDAVQDAFRAEQELWLHGWIYDMRDGLIKPVTEIDRTTPLDDLARPDRVLLATGERT